MPNYYLPNHNYPNNPFKKETSCTKLRKKQMWDLTMVVNDCKKFSHSCSRDVYFHAPSHPGTQISAVLTSFTLRVATSSSYKCWLLVCCFLVHYHDLIGEKIRFWWLFGVHGCGDFYERISSFISSSKLIVPIYIPDLTSLLGTSNKRQR